MIEGDKASVSCVNVAMPLEENDSKTRDPSFRERGWSIDRFDV